MMHDLLLLRLTVCLIVGMASLVPASSDPGGVQPLQPPRWPLAFFAEFQEKYPSDNASTTGIYGVDSEYKDPSTGIQGAQVVTRGYGNRDPVCNDLRPGSSCTHLAVGGQRYILWAASPVDDCCVCCSWADGCGPVEMTKDAAFEGQRTINGQVCNSFKMLTGVLGLRIRHMLLRVNDSQPCEITSEEDGAAHDDLLSDAIVFEPTSYTSNVDPGLFALDAASCPPCSNATYTCQLNQ